MQTLVNELQETITILNNILESIDSSKIDATPFEGSWSAGQVLEHVDLAISPGLLEGTTQPVSRPADQKVATVRNAFLDFNTKFKSPAFIEPRQHVHDKSALQASINEKFDDLIEAAKELDLSRECLDFEVPGMGLFTRMEWISFYMIHTQRHNHQLQKIASCLHAKDARTTS
ncbi:MAG: DinB family protein [Chitinophagaceae bacterium]|nr:MAG: DinB family protein [Chitinophagaceae bacterium]